MIVTRGVAVPSNSNPNEQDQHMLNIKIARRVRIVYTIIDHETLLHALNTYAFSSAKIKCIRLSDDFINLAISITDTTLTLAEFRRVFKTQKNAIREVYRVRGYTETETQIQINANQPNNYDIDEYAKRHNISIEEATKIVAELRASSSILSLKYWMKRGLSESDARNRVSHIQSINGNKYAQKRKDYPEQYAGTSPTELMYWIKKGNSIEESRKLQSQRQATFSLNECINKFGVEDGTARWKTRQNNWQHTLSLLSDEEKDRIAIAKVKNSRGSVSKIEKRFIDMLISNGMELTTQIPLSYSGPRGTQRKIYDVRIDNCLIEFNGDYYHANPSTHPNQTHVKTTPVEVIRKNDEFKLNLAKEHGYNLIVIWESEFNKSPTDVLMRVQTFVSMNRDPKATSNG